MTKEELISKIDGLEMSEETKIALMEDITDLDIPGEIDSSELDAKNAELDAKNAELDAKNAELDELREKYEELRENYKRRFMDGDPAGKGNPDEEHDEDDVIIDVKEI